MPAFFILEGNSAYHVALPWRMRCGQSGRHGLLCAWDQCDSHHRRFHFREFSRDQSSSYCHDVWKVCACQRADPLRLFRVCSLNITLWVVMRRVLQDIPTNPVVMHGGPDYHFLSLLQNVGAIH